MILLILLLSSVSPMLATHVDFAANNVDSTFEAEADDSFTGYLKFGSDGGFLLVKSEEDEVPSSPDWLVKGLYKNMVNSTGWGFLEISTNAQHADKLQAFGAGYYEGFVTSELLYMYYQNTIIGRCDGKEQLCLKIDKWLKSSLKWLNAKIKRHTTVSHSRNSAVKAYWHQVSLFMSQLSGLAEGYNAAVKGKNQTISLQDIIVMNVFGDLEDLESALGEQDAPSNKVLGKGHCSALVRLLPGQQDLLVSHDTWNSYQSMLRLMKRYNLPYKISPDSSQTVPGSSMAFSGYPGVIYSGDDFTIANSGLTILETTIGNSNPELWKLVKPESVLEGIRSMVANRLAVDGRSWTKIFSRHNSGTYNNQWMVIDFNKFRAGEKLSEDLLWVLEQIPGHIHADDVTKVLEDQSYWPSYNTPYFKDIYNMSGNIRLKEKYGDWFSYEKTPRAQIFRRDAPKVTDIDSMIRLMRYNNYTQDPLSRCEACSPPYSAENAISARNDLNPRNGTYPFPALSHRSHGGTDMKMTTSLMASELQLIVQGGPTWDPLPPFRWSEQDFKDTPHVGQPDLWKFPALVVSWD